MGHLLKKQFRINWLTRPQTKSMTSLKSIGIDLKARGKKKPMGQPNMDMDMNLIVLT